MCSSDLPLRSLVAPDAEMLHEFGSSETGRVSIRPMLVGETLGAGRVPVGRPIGRRRVRFEPLDDRGLRRQLFVSDPDSVAYLGDDALTAQRFSRDADGILWYATGDVFGESPDGELHHVGRIDDMVKINGMLVEPLEAELALRSMPGISAAVVLPHETPSGDLRLVGQIGRAHV